MSESERRREGHGVLLARPVAVALAAACTLPMPAHADPSVDAAQRAHEATQEHCLTIYGGGPGDQAGEEHYPAITAALAEVSEVYKESKAAYLLFWRGALYQCLNNVDLAKVDFEAFIAAGDAGGMFADLVRQAKVRLRRLEGRERPGQGAAATWARRRSRLDLVLGYHAGMAVRDVGCTDGTEVLSTLNGPCSEDPALAAGLSALPLAGSADLSAWPHAVLGVGGRVAAELPLRSDAVDPEGRNPGPDLSVAAGPRIRILQATMSGSRAASLRIEPAFAAAFGREAVLAGNASRLDDLGLLDAGAWATRHLGAELALRAEVELGARVLLSLDGRFSGFPPQGAGATVPIATPEEAAVTMVPGGEDGLVEDKIVVDGVPSDRIPDAVTSYRLAALGAAGLLVVVPGRQLALGPVFSVGWSRFRLGFPNDPAFAWCSATIVDGAEGNLPDCGYSDGSDEQGTYESPSPRERKVYSTRRDGFYVRFGIEVRFGAGGV